MDKVWEASQKHSNQCFVIEHFFCRHWLPFVLWSDVVPDDVLVKYPCITHVWEDVLLLSVALMYEWLSTGDLLHLQWSQLISRPCRMSTASCVIPTGPLKYYNREWGGNCCWGARPSNYRKYSYLGRGWCAYKSGDHVIILYNTGGGSIIPANLKMSRFSGKKKYIVRVAVDLFWPPSGSRSPGRVGSWGRVAFVVDDLTKQLGPLLPR